MGWVDGHDPSASATTHGVDGPGVATSDPGVIDDADDGDGADVGPVEIGGHAGAVDGGAAALRCRTAHAA